MQNQQQPPKEFKVQENVLVAVINYLATKPYKETAELIGALQQSAQLPAPKPPQSQAQGEPEMHPAPKPPMKKVVEEAEIVEPTDKMAEKIEKPK